MKKRVLVALLSLSLFAAAGARAQGSQASAFSMLPVAVSIVAAPGIVVGGSAFTVAAVEAVAGGSVWVLERASDGARVSVTVSGQVAGGVSVAAGTALAVTAITAGWVLSSAGQAVAFIPNEVGKALMHNQRVTP